MTTDKAVGSGTREEPWVLKTPPGTSEFTAFPVEDLDPPTLVVQVGRPRSDTTSDASTTSTRC
jgi:hypothetical protein